MVKNKSSVLVFGRGQMASFLPTYFKNVTISNADVTKPDEIERDFAHFSPSVVINTAAKTNIDWCEVNKTEAFAVNTLGAQNIWEASKKNNVYMCHFSSGCIFHSHFHDEIYTEKDLPNPRCYYSWTKVWAENLLGKSDRLLVLRPRVVISSEISRRNTLAKWMVYSHFISDQNSVSIVEDMLPVVSELVDKRISGTFNIVNKGTISPLEVAHILKEVVNPKLAINETTLDEVNKNLVAKRCSTLLNTDALRTLGYELPHVNESITKVVESFAKNLDKAGGLSALDEMRNEARAKYTLLQNQASTFSGEN